MELLIGVVLALGICSLCTWFGLDRDRALYPVMMIVIAGYYILFALMSDASLAVLLESIVALLFVGAALIGFKSNLWFVVFALAAHGATDLAHAGLIANPGVPLWWAEFCLAFDVVAAAYLGFLLLTRRVTAAG